MAKVEVQIRSCFCCGLTPGSIFVALYTLLLYSLLTALAAWALSDTANNGDSSYYQSCEAEALGQIRADNRKLTFHNGQTTVIVEDSTSYHCSFGLYTEELKFAQAMRYSVLVFDICLYVLLVAASIILLAGLAMYNQWFLIPWIILMFVDIIRGIISTIFIFVYSHGNLARIATGIFFLGLQFFHISILLIIVAKFQRIHNHKRGVVVDADKQYDPRYYQPHGPASLPSNYNGGYGSPGTQLRHNGSGMGLRPPTEPYGPAYSDYSPSSHKEPSSHFQGPPPQPHQGYYDAGYAPNAHRY
ncbi:hypothetical protein Ddc_07674 [Ditylenchus destructor]|nr:hypothetical protein Ddc_07674 [Ditylenchus destructor]